MDTDLNIPKNLEEFLRQGKGLEYDRDTCEMGTIKLECHDVIIRTAKDGSPEIKTTMVSVGKLFNIVQAKKFRVAKLIADFDGFHRR